MTDEPLDSAAEQAVIDVLRGTPLPPLPDTVRHRLAGVLREAARTREADHLSRPPRTIGA